LETPVDSIDNKTRPDTRTQQSSDHRRRVSPVPSRAVAVRLLHFAARVPVDGGPRDALEYSGDRLVVDHGLGPAISHGIFKFQSKISKTNIVVYIILYTPLFSHIRTITLY